MGEPSPAAQGERDELARSNQRGPESLVGKPVIKGTRIAVEFVVDLLGRGWTTEQILREYDHLSPKDIQACLAYASEVLKSECVYLLPT
jgi:uncharacterized protein (DUF433 family)